MHVKNVGQGTSFLEDFEYADDQSPAQSAASMTAFTELICRRESIAVIVQAEGDKFCQSRDATRNPAHGHIIGLR